MNFFPWSNWNDTQLHNHFTISEQAAIEYCKNMAFGHYENFPVVSAILNKKITNASAAIYAFARVADDFADEEEFAPFRIDLLNEWEQQLNSLYNGNELKNPVFVALKFAVNEFSLPKEEFVKLLSAFRQDCTKNRYETMDEVLDYCKRSANPVGRLMLALFGIDDEKSIEQSDAICTALQLANFWQDISVDASKNRIYIPTQIMQQFGVSENDILLGTNNENTAKMIRYLISFTQTLFIQGLPLLTKAGFPASIYLFFVWLGGMSILGLERLNVYELTNKRPDISLGSIKSALLKFGKNRFLKVFE